MVVGATLGTLAGEPIMANLRNVVQAIGPIFPQFLETQAELQRQRQSEEQMALERQRIEQALAIAQAQEDRERAKAAQQQAEFEALTAPKYYTEGTPGLGEYGPMPQARSLLDIQALSEVEQLRGKQQEREQQARLDALLGGLPEVNLGEVGLPGVTGQIPARGLGTYSPLIGLQGTRERISAQQEIARNRPQPGMAPLRPNVIQDMRDQAYKRSVDQGIMNTLSTLDEAEQSQIQMFGNAAEYLASKYPEHWSGIISQAEIDADLEVSQYLRGGMPSVSPSTGFPMVPPPTSMPGAAAPTAAPSESDALLRYIETGEGEEELFGE